MHVYFFGNLDPASSESEVAGIIPGSELAVKNIIRFVRT